MQRICDIFIKIILELTFNNVPSLENDKGYWMDIFCIFVTLCGGKVTFVQLDSYLSCYANLAMMMITDHLHDIHRPGDQYCCSPQHISVTVTAPVQCNIVM